MDLQALCVSLCEQRQHHPQNRGKGTWLKQAWLQASGIGCKVQFAERLHARPGPHTPPHSTVYLALLIQPSQLRGSICKERGWRLVKAGLTTGCAVAALWPSPETPPLLI